MSFSLTAKTVRTLSFVVPFLLSGCAADRYFMVEKKNLSTLEKTLAADHSNLSSHLDSRAEVRHSQVIESLDAATHSILDAIQNKVEKPVCPPPPEPPPPVVCPSVVPQVVYHREEVAPQKKTQADVLKGKMIVGQVENFYLANPGLIYEARMDSGAETSSLDARNIERFERDGTNWVRFEVPNPNGKGVVTLEREVSRKVRVVQSNTEEVERRVVVELQFQIGNYRKQAEFTLTSREHLKHPVLVGRNILRDVMMVDVGREFATELPSNLPLMSADASTEEGQ